MNPISKYLLIAAALIVLLTGVIPSIVADDWTWFGRSGAILTTFGIVITFLDLQGFLAGSVKDISARIDRRLNSHDLTKVSQEEIEHQKEIILNGVISSLRRVEFSILIVGTIVSGYGGLVGI